MYNHKCRLAPFWHQNNVVIYDTFVENGGPFKILIFQILQFWRNLWSRWSWGGHLTPSSCLSGSHSGSHWSSLGLMLGHIWTLRGILGVPRTLLWLTFGAILAYPLLSWIDLCVTRLLCGTLWVTCIHFLCIMSLLFFCAIFGVKRQRLARRST